MSKKMPSDGHRASRTSSPQALLHSSIFNARSRAQDPPILKHTKHGPRKDLIKRTISGRVEEQHIRLDRLLQRLNEERTSTTYHQKRKGNGLGVTHSQEPMQVNNGKIFSETGIAHVLSTSSSLRQSQPRSEHVEDMDLSHQAKQTIDTAFEVQTEGPLPWKKEGYCKVCKVQVSVSDKKSVVAGSMYRHYKHHCLKTAKQKRKCDSCGREFARLDSLKRHMKGSCSKGKADAKT